MDQVSSSIFLSSILLVLVTALSVTFFLFAFRLLKHRANEIVPIARDLVLEKIQDGVIILDPLGRLVDINPAAREITGLQDLKKIGQSLTDLLPEWMGQIDLSESESSFNKEIEVAIAGVKNFYHLRISKITNQKGVFSGCLIMIQKINDLKKLEVTTKENLSQLELTVAERTEDLTDTIIRLEEEIHERQRTEEGLRYSESKFRTVFEQSSEAFLLINSEGRYMEMNPAFEQLIGRKREEILGRPFWEVSYELAPPEKRITDRIQVYKNIFNEALQNESQTYLNREFEGEIWRPDGSIRLILQTFFLVHTEEGKRLGSVLRDITDQKVAREEANPNVINLNEVNNLAMELAEVTALDQLYKRVGEKIRLVTGALACIITQYEPTEECLTIEYIAAKSAVLHQASKLLHTSVKKMRIPMPSEKKSQILAERFGYRSSLTEMTFGKIPENLSTLLKEKFHIGAMIVVSLQLEGELFGTISIYLSENTAPPSIEMLNTIANVVSVSIKRKKAEQELRTNEERFRALLENTNDLISILDKTGRRKYLANINSYNRVLGYSIDQLKEQSVFDIIHPDDLPATQSLFKEMVEGKILHKVIMFRAKRNDGHWIYLETDIQNLSNNPLIEGIVVTARDITDRIKAEAQRGEAIVSLRESEEKMQSIFRVAPTGIGVVKDRVLIYVNPKVCEMVGYRQDELIGQSARILYPTQEDYEFVGREKYRQISDHDSGRVETLWQRKDGSIINIILASTPIDLKDLSKGVTFTALDITDRKKAEKALQESEEKFRKIFETSEIGISTNDLDGHFTSGNPALLKMFGYSLQEYCNLTVKDISHPDDELIDLTLSQEMLEGKRGYFTIEKRNRHKNGHYIWGQLTSVLIRDSADTPQYAMGMFEDISKRKETEEALHEREKFIQTIIDTVPVGIFTVNKEGIINYLNPAGQKIWQGVRYVNVDDLMEYKGWRLSDGSRVEAHEWGSAKAVMHGETTLDEEIEIEAFDGTHKIISNSGIPLYDDNGNINGAVAILQDITGRKMSEKALQQSSEDIRAAYDATLQGWSNALELREHETAGHSQRVVNLTIDMARRFGIPEEEIPQIQRGALLHDIGKMGIPDSILLKPGQLTDDEWVVMKQHPVYARQLLSGIPYLAPALDIPYYHHERWNGSGYPCGLKGEEIPLSARIFAVVDMWDALGSDRPYRKGWPENEILRYFREKSGVLLDPEVVKVFIEMIHPI